jgi:hypothetical protein
MKKITLFTVLMTSLALASAAAQADRHHDGDGDDNGLSSFEVLATFATTTTVNQNDDERAVYVQQVHEDAANYLTQGTVTALLQEAMTNLRTQLQSEGAAATDAQIATGLMTSTTTLTATVTATTASQ